MLNTQKILPLSLSLSYFFFKAKGIDQLIVEEAALGRCKAGITAKQLIEEAYHTYLDPKSDTTSKCEEESEIDSGNKTYEELLEKFEAIAALKYVFRYSIRN